MLATRQAERVLFVNAGGAAKDVFMDNLIEVAESLQRYMDITERSFESLTTIMKQHEGSQSDLWDMVNDHHAWIMSVDKLIKQFYDGYHEKICHLTNKTSELEATTNLLIREIERLKQIQNPEVYNARNLSVLSEQHS